MPGALTWDPTPAGGALSTARGAPNPTADGSALNAAEVAGVRALVSGAGIRGIGGQTFLYDGAPVPDPRRHVVINFAAAGDTDTSDYLPNVHGDRRTLVALASQTTNSGVTELAGGQSVAVFGNAAAAGLRWAASVAQAQQYTAQADSSVAVIDIQGA